MPGGIMLEAYAPGGVLKALIDWWCITEATEHTEWYLDLNWAVQFGGLVTVSGRIPGSDSESIESTSVKVLGRVAGDAGAERRQCRVVGLFVLAHVDIVLHDVTRAIGFWRLPAERHRICGDVGDV